MGAQVHRVIASEQLLFLFTPHQLSKVLYMLPISNTLKIFIIFKFKQLVWGKFDSFCSKSYNGGSKASGLTPEAKSNSVEVV